MQTRVSHEMCQSLFLFLKIDGFLGCGGDFDDPFRITDPPLFAYLLPNICLAPLLLACQRCRRFGGKIKVLKTTRRRTANPPRKTRTTTPHGFAFSFFFASCADLICFVHAIMNAEEFKC